MRTARAFVLLAALIAASSAHSQQAILQGGPSVPGDVPQYVSQGSSQPIVMDGGTSGGGQIGTTLGQIGITSRDPNGLYPSVASGRGPYGSHLCLYDAPTDNATGYHWICLDPNTQGGGLISYGAGGSATPLPLQFSINGSIAPIGNLNVITNGVTAISGAPNGGVLFNNSGLADFSKTLPTGLTIPNLVVTGFLTATGLVTNADLVNPSMTINGSTCTLGGSCTAYGTAQTANTVLAGPASGSPATPAYRVLVPADIPTSIRAVTPEDYGAKCDGSTDDSTALQNWLNALNSDLGGFIPPSPTPCTFQSALAPPVVNGLSIWGAGIGASELRYTGSNTAVTPIIFGTTDNSCSMSGLTIHDFLVSSATLMTAGSGINLYDTCGTRMFNMSIANNAGGGYGNWFQGIGIVGGNQVYMTNNAFTGSSTAVLAYGDSSVQLTDLRINGGIIIGATIGINIGGNIGGFNLDGASVLQNGTNLKISQDFVAHPNLQVFLGPLLDLDVTSGGTGRDIDIEDAGGSGSILTINGTWIASAATSCFNIASGTTWIVQWTGGNLVNCGTDGLTQNSTTVTVHATSVLTDFTGDGYSGSTGYAFNCVAVNQNVFLKDIHFFSWGASGPYSANCHPQTFTSFNTPEIFSTVINGNLLNPTLGWQYDTSTQTPLTVASGSNIALASHGNGLVAVGNQTNGDIGLYDCGGGTCVLVSSSLSTWVSSTTTPASGKMSVAFDGSTYSIYNNTGSSVNANAMLLKVTNTP